MPASRFYGRSRARSQALQLLFQAEVTERPVGELLTSGYVVSDVDPLDGADVPTAVGGVTQSEDDVPLDEYARELALGADAMRDELDAIIGKSSKNWTVDRMPLVDRNLLRLAIYEMLKVDEVAIAVSIDESVELAKAYGTDESSRFVNGLLGRIAHEIEGA